MIPLNSVVSECSNDLRNFFEEIAGTFYEGVERPSGFTLVNCIEAGERSLRRNIYVVFRVSASTL